MAQLQSPLFRKEKPATHGSWWRVLLTGILFYFLGLFALILSANPNLFPTVVMIGNFLIPVTYVAFFYDQRHLSRLTLPSIAKGFVYGGLVGVFAASILEPLLVSQLNLGSAFVVGMIEEFAKILGILIIARHQEHNSEMDGIILGAAAGMGFAALESNGYVFNAFLQSGGSLSTSVYVTLLRGILSPLGHGTWTAILLGVIYRESEPGRFHFNRKVWGAYLTVVLLHGLWDGLPPVISAVFAPGLDVFIAQAIVGGIGLLILWARWREAKRLQEERYQASLLLASRQIAEAALSPDWGSAGLISEMAAAGDGALPDAGTLAQDLNDGRQV